MLVLQLRGPRNKLHIKADPRNKLSSGKDKLTHTLTTARECVNEAWVNSEVMSHTKSVLAGLGAARIRAHASAVKNPRTKFCNARRVYDKHPMNAAPKPPNYVKLYHNGISSRRFRVICSDK